MTTKSLSQRALLAQQELLEPCTCLGALRNGGMETKLSAVVMGLGNLVHRQYIKGLLFLAIEVAYVLFMIFFGFHNLYMLGSLGTEVQTEVWSEELQVYLYEGGDQSILLLLYGIATILVTLVMFWICLPCGVTPHGWKEGQYLCRRPEGTAGRESLPPPDGPSDVLYHRPDHFAADLHDLHGLHQLQQD